MCIRDRHYTDYVENPEEYPLSGMGAANVGPEFTLSLIHIFLSPRQREAIYLLFYDGLSEAEAAETLGISRSSLRTHRDRALEKLKTELEKNWWRKDNEVK